MRRFVGQRHFHLRKEKIEEQIDQAQQERFLRDTISPFQQFAQNRPECQTNSPETRVLFRRQYYSEVRNHGDACHF